MRAELLATTLVATLMALLVIGCDEAGEDGPRRNPRAAVPQTTPPPAERSAIRAAVVRLFRADVDVACERSLTPRLFRLIFRHDAACRKVGAAQAEESPPERVEVSDIRADRGRATAHARLIGGANDAAQGRVGLLEEGAGWRADDLSAPLLRSLIAAGLRNERQVSGAALRCLDGRLRRLGDARLKRFAYALIGRRPGAETRILRLLTECERRGGGVSSVRRTLERSLRRTLRRAGARPAVADCVLLRLRRTLPDGLVIELTAKSDDRSRARARTTVTRELVAALAACGGGRIDPQGLSQA